MSKKHTEARLEDAIEHYLITQHGFVKGESSDYDASLALEPERLVAFFKATQEKIWNALEAIHGVATGKIVLDALVKELTVKGMLKVLRHGFKCYGRNSRSLFSRRTTG